MLRESQKLNQTKISISCLKITLKLHPNYDRTLFKSQTFIKRQNDDGIKTNIKPFNACMCLTCQ